MNSIRVTVPRVGDFEILGGSMRLKVSIAVRQSRLLTGVSKPSAALLDAAGALAECQLRIIRAPEDFNLAEVDLIDPGAMKRVTAVLKAIRDAEQASKPPAITPNEASHE